MDLVGKYLFAKLAEPTFWLVLGVRPANPNSERLYTIAGTAQGENSQGFWLRVDGLYGADGQVVQIDGASLPMTFLIPWASAFSIIAYDAKPAAAPIGFRPRAIAVSQPEAR
jgi:hypothetical protein